MSHSFQFVLWSVHLAFPAFALAADSPWSADWKDWKKPTAGEYPRFLFHKSDLPEIKKRVNPNGELRADSSWAVAALGYDLCYDGWGEADRKRIAKAFLDVKANQGFNLEKVVRTTVRVVAGWSRA